MDITKKLTIKQSMLDIAMIVALFFLPLSTSLSSIAFVVFIIMNLINFNSDCVKLLSKSFMAKFFLLGFVLIVFAVSYSNSSWYESFYVLKKYSWLLIAPILMVTYRANQDSIKNMDWLLFAIVIMVVASYLNYFLHFSFTPHSRIETFFQDRIKHAYLVLVGVILCLNNACVGRKPKLNLLLLSVLVINLIFINDSRTGYLLSIPVIITTFVVADFSSRFKWIVACSLLLLLILFSFNQRGISGLNRAANVIKNYKLQQVNRTSLGIRFDQWYFGIKSWQKRPLFGYGTGSSGQVINNEQYLTINQSLHKNTAPVLIDSGIVNIFVQWGMAGMIYFSALFLLLLKFGYQLSSYHRRVIINLIVLNLTGSLFNNWLATTIPTHLFVLIFTCFALLNTQHPMQKQRQEPDKGALLHA